MTIKLLCLATSTTIWAQIFTGLLFYVLRYSKWEDWSLTITNSFHGLNKTVYIVGWRATCTKQEIPIRCSTPTWPKAVLHGNMGYREEAESLVSHLNILIGGTTNSGGTFTMICRKDTGWLQTYGEKEVATLIQLYEATMYFVHSLRTVSCDSVTYVIGDKLALWPLSVLNYTVLFLRWIVDPHVVLNAH